MHTTYVQYVYVFVYIVHTYETRVGQREREREREISISCFSRQLITLQIVQNFPIIVHLILFECLQSKLKKMLKIKLETKRTKRISVSSHDEATCKPLAAKMLVVLILHDIIQIVLNSKLSLVFDFTLLTILHFVLYLLYYVKQRALRCHIVGRYHICLI